MKRTRSTAAWLLVRCVFALTIVAPLVCQDEARPYFSISSGRTFGSTETPAVMLSGWQVDAVQIRVYRVNDPVKFFRELEDAHGFGGTRPRVGVRPTLLERIHNWKRGVRRSIRADLRSQFSESPSAHLRQLFPSKPAAASQNRAAYFANAPILNQDQLLLSFIQPLSGRAAWNSSTVSIPVKRKGLFLVEAVHGNLRAYTILMVSDIVLVTKAGRDHVLGWLADRVTGEPVPNASITSMPPKGKAVTVTTGPTGLAELPVSDTTSEDVRVVAVRGGDYAANDIGSWIFSSRNRNWTGYIYTERPVYRPGNTMHFRGILRRQAVVGYEIPANQSVSVQISDPDGKAVYQKTLMTTANGIIHDDFAVPSKAPLGNYWIQVKAGESNMGGNFEVQEYKKPEYEVRVTPATPRVLQGQSAKATIDARYYFGEPVSNAKVKYSVYRSRYWFPLWYEPDEGSDVENFGDQYDDANSELVVQADGELDADGKLDITVPTTVSDHKIDYRYRIQAEVTDKAGRSISGTGGIIATYGSFLVNVTPDRYFVEPGTTTNVKIESRDYDSQPVSTPVHVELITWDWRNRTKGQTKSQSDVRTDANGAATTELRIPSEGGSYRVLVSARTPENRTVENESYIWVSGGNESSLWGGPEVGIQIVPDKKTYQPGDTAKILVVTGQPNTSVLVTVEGRDIRSKTVLRAQHATALFQYTVSREDEPGFFVSAQFIRNGQMYQGQKRVKVPPRDHELNVKLATDKPQYLPGQTAIYQIEVTTCDGKPAAQADLSLGVVDEAIYAIRPDNMPDIVNFFYGREWNSVATDNSLTYFFNGEAGTRRMRLAEIRAPSQLAQLKPERLIQPKIRKAFPDTAFWAADLTTDSAGHAQARVEFPDSLTTWRATARGVAPGDRFGGAVLKTVVRKNLIVRLALPRFFVQGDEVVISALVHNYLQTTKHARVQLQIQGLDVLNGAATQEVDIASRGEAKIDWRVKAQIAKEAKIIAAALTDEESDALEMDLPIHPPGVPVRQARSGSISNSGSTALSLTFPAGSIPGSRSLEIHLSSSVAGSIFGALQYLTSFPYGCVEQTMSSFLPDIMVSKVVTELGLKEPIDASDLNQKIQAGLDRLYGFQHADGGWGWWVSDASHPFMTAYVVAGLSEARADGTQIRPGTIDRSITWLEKILASEKQLAPDLHAYMTYALTIAGQPNRGALDQSYSRRTELSPYGVALLGLAFDQTKDSRASELATQLEKTARQNESEAWWPASRDEMLDFTADVTPEATAYAMKLISRQHPNSALLPKAALWLVDHRDEGYWWSSTKQTAMVIYGLVDYLKTTNELHPDFAATVSVNGQNATTRSFNSEGPPAEEVVLDESKLQPDGNQVQISSEGQGRLYYSVTAAHNYDQARLEKQGAVSLNLLRDYFRLEPSRSGDQIVYNLASLNGPVAQGDILAVRLTVTGSDWRYLVVEDPIPAGTEFIEQDSLYKIANKPPWWEYWFTRRELHDDRMAIFQTRFMEGQQQYFYLLRVVNPGSFHVSPARVQPMYQPEHQATTEARTLEVK
ncbi:MAG TPA: MG2 domain-containing protein [Bryobacteraceae bacterium]|jgi:hypothetical protein